MRPVSSVSAIPSLTWRDLLESHLEPVDLRVEVGQELRDRLLLPDVRGKSDDGALQLFRVNVRLGTTDLQPTDLGLPQPKRVVDTLRS